MALVELYVRATKVFMGEVEDGSLVENLTELKETLETKDAERVDELLVALARKRMLKRCGQFYSDVVKLLGSLSAYPSFWSLEQRIGVHEMRSEYERFKDECRIWDRDKKNDTAFEVRAAINGALDQAKTLNELKTE